MVIKPIIKFWKDGGTKYIQLECDFKLSFLLFPILFERFQPNKDEITSV